MNLQDYYRCYNDYFWTWEEEGGVLAIPGGSTIGFSKQVAEILGAMAEQGLPPFGSFLLAMIATNKTMDDSVGRAESIISAWLQVHIKTNSWDDSKAEAFQFLRMLQNMPAEYKAGKRRRILLQTVFAQSHNRLNGATSKGIAIDLSGYSRAGTIFSKKKDLPQSVLYKELRVVALLNRQFPSTQSVIDAMGELPELEPEEMPALETITATDTAYEDFVDELMQHPETFQTAALIKPVWAGLKIPINNAHPSEQPLGGVSDLSNKGDFDKLLVSEFANDELVFINRVANNEALYLHREMPPVKDNLHRTVLIDISLKCWGTPKILAFASYIAIARHPKAVTQSDAFVLGDRYTPVSCYTTGEIIDALQQTDAALNPGNGLAAFMEANKQDRNLEIFYITTAAAIQYPAVQQQLVNYNAYIRYVITVTDTGEINFYRNKKSRMQHLQTICLSLEKLWQKKPARLLTPPPPVAVLQESLPLLLHIQHKISKLIPLLPDEEYCVAGRSLFRRKFSPGIASQKGWELVLRNVAGGSLYEVGRLPNGQVHFLSYNPQNKEVCITCIDTSESAKSIFENGNTRMYREFLFDGYGSFVMLLQNPDGIRLAPDFKTGTITFEQLLFTSKIFYVDYPARQEEVRKHPVTYNDANILKNITSVSITGDNRLVFNNHQLYFDHHNRVFFSSHNYIDQAFKATAKRSGHKREFIFSDGSMVSVDDNGYIRLISSNQAIAEVFIVANITSFPGMATSTFFAGNELYYNGDIGKVGIFITNVGEEAISCIKIIKTFTQLGLAQVKEVIDTAPRLLPGKMYYEEAMKMKAALAEKGCIVVVEPATQQRQTIISADAFYRENILTFIEHILSHAAEG
ncbi:MAG: ribosomal protein L7/L12 [Ferruginibacter sp.]